MFLIKRENWIVIVDLISNGDEPENIIHEHHHTNTAVDIVDYQR